MGPVVLSLHPLSVLVFIPGDKLSLFLPFTGENTAPDFQLQVENNLVGFCMPGRESLIALGTGAHPGPILHCHIVQTWLPTSCPVGSDPREAVPRERGGAIRNWANHSRSVYFRWKFYESVEGFIKSCLEDNNLQFNQNSTASSPVRRLPSLYTF